MLGMGVQLLIWPEGIEFTAFRYLLEIFKNSVALLTYCLVLGSYRIIALTANGRWPIQGPIIRSVCAIGGAVLWFSIFAALIRVRPEVAGVSPLPGTPIFLVGALVELVATYRAATDVRDRSR